MAHIVLLHDKGHILKNGGGHYNFYAIKLLYNVPVYISDMNPRRSNIICLNNIVQIPNST